MVHLLKKRKDGISIRNLQLMESIAKIYLAFCIASFLSLIVLSPSQDKIKYSKDQDNFSNAILDSQNPNIPTQVLDGTSQEGTKSTQNLTSDIPEPGNFANPNINNNTQIIFLPLMSQIKNGNLNQTVFPQRSDFDFMGINFAAQDEPISISIMPRDRSVNHGKVITIRFRPGATCTWGERHACVYSFVSSSGQPIIFITVHSGIGGEAQGFRHAIEGTGINGARYSFAQTLQNMESLSGSEVLIRQGENKIINLSFNGMIRIPSNYLKQYIILPVEESFNFASNIETKFTQNVDPSFPLIVLETCGWHMRGEIKVFRISPTSSSIYLGLIQPIKP